ncbi:MAG: putative metal-binding motif-containing protein, partial [Myxococcota bacterium]
MGRALLLLPFVLAGCTLLGLDDFDLAQCQRHSDCEVLNEAEGIPEDACQRYGCVVGTCELRDGDLDGDGVRAARCGGDDCDDDAFETFPGAPERCDRVDNDCDAIADEGVGVLREDGAPVRSTAPVAEAALTGSTLLWS